MNAREYRAALNKLALSQLAAARLFHLSARTSRSYALDESRVPETVAILLRLMLARKITIGDVERAAR